MIWRRLTNLVVDKSLRVRGDLVLPKSRGGGILLDDDTAKAEYGWRDIIGRVQPKATGAGHPTRTQYSGANVYDYAFVANDVCDFGFHIPHDHVPSVVCPASELYLHIHWSHNGTAISGNVEFTFYWQYSRGHDQEVFHAEKSTTITYDTTNIATTPRYRHRIDEVQITASAADANHTLNTDIEPDGMIIGTLKVTTLPTITAGSLFVHTVDVHYQSTSIGTLRKAPDFWI